MNMCVRAVGHSRSVNEENPVLFLFILSLQKLPIQVKLAWQHLKTKGYQSAP